MKGLRWLDTVPGWTLIREKIASTVYWRDEIVELLAHNDTTETRDLLARSLKDDSDSDVTEKALEAARKLWGSDSLEPDYLLIQNPDREIDEMEDSVKRVCEKGDVSKILELYARVGSEVQERLSSSLFTRPELPVAGALAGLNGNAESSVALSARILGRATGDAKAIRPVLEKSLEKWQAIWMDRCRKELAGRANPTETAASADTTLKMLLWASSRYGAGSAQAATLLTFLPEDRVSRPIRLAALDLLGNLTTVDPAAMATLKTLLSGNDAEIRTRSATIVAARDAKAATELLPTILSDRLSFNRLVASASVDALPALRRAVPEARWQGVVLPHLVARGDIETLSTVARDVKLAEAARLGAVEALGELASEPAEAILLTLGQNDKDDEDVRKAAWKAVSRSRRARKKRDAGVTAK